MKVGDFIPWMSDHCPIYFSLDLYHKVEKEKEEIPKTVAPENFVWTDLGKLKFQNMIKSGEFQKKLDLGLKLNYEEPNSVVNFISDTLIEASEKVKIKTNRNGEEGPPWFDNQCKGLQREIKSLVKEIKT